MYVTHWREWSICVVGPPRPHASVSDGAAARASAGVGLSRNGAHPDYVAAYVDNACSLCAHARILPVPGRRRHRSVTRLSWLDQTAPQQP